MGRHLWELRSGRHHSQKLQRAFVKYGEGAFQFRVLLFCAKAQVDFFEARAIQMLDTARNGYNVAHEPKGGFMRGRKWPEATKAARVQAMQALGVSPETRRKMMEGLAAMPPEAKRLHRERIGLAQRKPKSEQGRKNIGEATAKRLKDPALAEQRRAASLKAWVTRRARQQAATPEGAEVE